jgi:hypothetical protein
MMKIYKIIIVPVVMRKLEPKTGEKKKQDVEDYMLRHLICTCYPIILG